MSLPKPEQVLRKLEQLESLRDATATNRQRRFARHTVRGEAIVTELHLPPTSGEDSGAALRDVALGGVGFLSTRELPTGSIRRIIFLNHHHVVGSAAIYIRHVRSVEDGLYLVGAQYLLDPGLMLCQGVDPAELEISINKLAKSDFSSPSDIRE
ncbi:MAG: hypothetical protein JJU36_00205 [Phycisphaeraceae bacterium]|nr:hypothetical protein [Phycisphaeraceae bacterium]